MTEKLPVALFAFNRPEYTLRTIEPIINYKPSCLYIYLDGPRKDNSVDIESLKQIKTMILERIPNDLNYTIIERESNLGCQQSIIQGLNSFFELEKFGIIIEDDCVVTNAFFSFCEYAYQNFSPTNIHHICGTNYLFNEFGEEVIYESKFGPIWGWATWSQNWKNTPEVMKLEINLTELYKKLKEWYGHDQFCDFIYKMFKDVLNKELDAWSLYLLLAQISCNKPALSYSKNLVRNIGENGTNRKSASPFTNMDVIEKFNRNAKYIKKDNIYDTASMNNVIARLQSKNISKEEKNQSIFSKIKAKINRIF